MYVATFDSGERKKMLIVISTETVFCDIPDEPFPNFRASKPVDRRFLCSSGSSRDGFQNKKKVKGS